MKHITLVLLFLVAACGPIYQTDYQVIPPTTETGRMCANNCLMAQTNCRQSCTIQDQQCEEISRLRAESDYRYYLDQQNREGRPAKRQLRDFYRADRCNADGCQAQCQNDYHLCHSNCGGQIVPYTYCTAFCDEAPALQP